MFDFLSARFASFRASVAAVAVGMSLVAGSVSAQTAPVLRIHNDPGGHLPSRVEMIKDLRRQQRRVEIRDGYCISACTLYLGLSTTCIGRNARFGFHGPNNRVQGIGLPPDLFEHWSQVMASHYPAPLRRWFMSKGRMVTVGFYEISGAELIGMGVPECA